MTRASKNLVEHQSNRHRRSSVHEINNIINNSQAVACLRLMAKGLPYPYILSA
jgi:hypothetical protein